MKELAENECLPDIVLSSSRIATAVVGVDGRLVYGNIAFCKLLGYAEPDLIGLSLASLVDAEIADELVLQVRAENLAHDGVDCQFIRKDAISIWVQAIASPLQGDHEFAGTALQLIDIERQREREEALGLNESRLNFALKAASQGVWDHDIPTDTMFYSAGWRGMRGIPLDEVIDSSIEAWMARLHPDDRDYIHSVAGRQDKGDRNFRILEYRERHRDGHYIWVQSRGRPVAWDDEGNAIRTTGTDTDITERRLADEEFQRLSRRLELALDVSRIGVWEQNLVTGQVLWDDRMYEIYGRKRTEEPMQASDWERTVHPDDVATANAELSRAIDKEEPYSSQFRIVLPNGEVRHIRSRAQIFKSASGSKLIGAEWDITADVVRAEELHLAMALAESRYVDLQNAQAHVQHAALHDYLTDLPNRRFLDQALVERREQAHGRRDMLAALHIDLDRFKEINDTMGHAAGDAMLQHVANLLRENVRDGDFIARVGGDEFVILCWFRGGTGDLGTMAERIIDSLRREVPYGGRFMHVGASIGIAYEADRDANAARLLQDADTAMYRAKDQGRNRYEFADL